MKRQQTLALIVSKLAQHVGGDAVAMSQAGIAGVWMKDDQHITLLQHAPHLQHSPFKAVFIAVVGAVAGYKVFQQGVEGGGFKHLVGDQHTSDSQLTSGRQWYTWRLCQPIVVP